MEYKIKLIKYLALAFFLCWVCYSCNQVKEPEFLRADKIKILKVNTDTLTLSCNSHFTNPNPVGGKLLSSDIDVTVDEQFLSKINQEHDISFGGNEEYSLPLIIKVPVKSLFEKKGSLFSKALKALINKSVEVRFTGTAKVEIAGIKFEVPIEKEQKVDIKL